MITLLFLTFVDLFVFVFNALILVRVLGSYIAQPGSRWQEGLVSVTEPVLAPVRRVLPRTPGLDLAPLAAFFALQLAQLMLHAMLGA